jgi:hypothetical protein
MCVVGEVEATAAVALLNEQRWISCEERMEREGEELLMSCVVTICIWLANPAPVSQDLAPPLPPLSCTCYHDRNPEVIEARNEDPDTVTFLGLLA